MKKNTLIVNIFTFFLLVGCESNQTEYEDDYSNEEYSENDELSEDETNSKIEDGTHSATVDYYNPNTGYSQSYTLDVEVENGEVNQINFPQGGHLDEDHINAEELDEDGRASVYGDNGSSYDITLDD